jgi:hypothetical protein
MSDAYTRSYSDNVSTSFVTMGAEPLTDHLVNVSGDRSPYTTLRPRGVPNGGSVPDAGTATYRGVGADATGEHSGPRFAPASTICYPNSPEASKTGRGLRTVPSKMGNQDFWDKRYESGEVI